MQVGEFGLNRSKFTLKLTCMDCNISLQQRFVIEDLDDRHLFIVPDPKVIAFIEKKMDEWNEKNTYQPPTQ